MKTRGPITIEQDIEDNRYISQHIYFIGCHWSQTVSMAEPEMNFAKHLLSLIPATTPPSDQNHQITTTYMSRQPQTTRQLIST